METRNIVMAEAKRIYIIKVNKLFSFSSSRCFLKEIENMYSMFLSSYTDTRESLGELEKAVETLIPTAFLVLSLCPIVFIKCPSVLVSYCLHYLSEFETKKYHLTGLTIETSSM